MPRVLLLMDARTYRATDFLSAARRLEVQVTVGTDAEQPATGDAAAGLAVDFAAGDAALEAILELHGRHPLEAVVAVEDAGAELAARAGERLGLPGNPAESVVSAAHKGIFRDICRAAGIATPDFREVSLADDPAALARTLDYPCVIKPLHLSASRGVIRADDPAEFEAAFRRVKALLARPEVRARKPALADRALVEHYLPGDEVAIEGLVADGELGVLAIMDKPDPLTGPFFQETMFVTPSRHAEAVQLAAVREAAAAVQALGLRQGPVHAELRLHEGRATLLELAPRSIGGHCSRILRFGAGMSLEELILRQALGRAPRTRRHPAAAGVLMIPIPHAGTLRAIEGVNAARAVPGIEDVDLTLHRGAAVEPPPEGDRYLGFLFARAETPDAVEVALREAHARLRIEIEPAGVSA